jgi:hypothetical protein
MVSSFMFQVPFSCSIWFNLYRFSTRVSLADIETYCGKRGARVAARRQKTRSSRSFRWESNSKASAGFDDVAILLIISPLAAQF